MKNHIIFGILITVLLVSFTLLCGCTSQEAAPSTPTPTTMPTTLTTVAPTKIPTTVVPTKTPTQVVRPASPIIVTFNSISGHYQTGNQFSQPRQGYQFVLVDFTIKNTGSQSGFYFNPNYAELEDPDKYRYDYDTSSYSVPGMFSSGTIPYGELRRGKLVFEVPEKWGEGTKYILWINP